MPKGTRDKKKSLHERSLKNEHLSSYFVAFGM